MTSRSSEIIWNILLNLIPGTLVRVNSIATSSLVSSIVSDTVSTFSFGVATLTIGSSSLAFWSPMQGTFSPGSILNVLCRLLMVFRTWILFILKLGTFKKWDYLEGDFLKFFFGSCFALSMVVLWATPCILWRNANNYLVSYKTSTGLFLWERKNWKFKEIFSFMAFKGSLSTHLIWEMVSSFFPISWFDNSITVDVWSPLQKYYSSLKLCC